MQRSVKRRLSLTSLDRHETDIDSFLCIPFTAQICVEPRPSALNMTLPANAADCGRLQQISIDSW